MINDVWEFWDVDAWSDDTWGEGSVSSTFNAAWDDANEIVGYFGDVE